MLAPIGFQLISYQARLTAPDDTGNQSNFLSETRTADAPLPKRALTGNHDKGCSEASHYPSGNPAPLEPSSAVQGRLHQSGHRDRALLQAHARHDPSHSPNRKQEKPRWCGLSRKRKLLDHAQGCEATSSVPPSTSTVRVYHERTAQFTTRACAFGPVVASHVRQKQQTCTSSSGRSKLRRSTTNLKVLAYPRYCFSLPGTSRDSVSIQVTCEPPSA